MAPKIIVCFPARNEEVFLPKVLDALLAQTVVPIKVIIANDGSTDKTKDIAESYEFVYVNDREKREGTVVGKKEMALVWNSSIEPAEKLFDESEIDYIVFLGGDIVLPPTYLENLSKKFEENENLMIAAGKMEGDHAYKSTGFMIPGPGRMMRYNYWVQLGGKYPYKQGWEAYPVYRANLDGYLTKIYDDVPYLPLRPTGGRTDYYAYGQAMKALGYSIPFAFGRILKQPFMSGRSIKSSFNMFRGFIFGKAELYESELRNFIKSTQRKRLRKLIFRF